MSERCISAFNDDRYAAVGDLVVRAAHQAQAELAVIQQELFKATLLGHATVRALETRQAQAASDAALLDAMAAHVLPPTNGGALALNGRATIRRRAEAAASNGSNNDDQPKRIRHYSEKTKAIFEERTFNYISVMVGEGCVVEERDGMSPSQIIRDKMVMPQTTWGNFSIRLRELGLLTFEKDPATKRNIRAYMERERVDNLIKWGDLPSEWAEELAKLDEQAIETQDEPLQAASPETAVPVDEAPDEYEPEEPVSQSNIVSRTMRLDLVMIHARHSKPARRRAADPPQKRRLGRF